MEPIDTFRKEWPEVVAARSSVASLVGVSAILTFGFAALLNNSVLSGKDATIENLKSRIETLGGEKADLEKKLASASDNDATIENLKKQMEGLKADRDDLAKKLTSAPKAQADEAAQVEALNRALKNRDDLRRQLDLSKKEASELRDQLNQPARTQLPEKSPIIGLDDAKRFQIVKAMTDGMPGDGPGCGLMQAFPPMAPTLQRTFDTWAEIQQPLFYAGWRFHQDTNVFIPPGISIVVGAQSGQGHECGRRLKDLLDGLNVHPVSFRVDDASPALAECKNVYKHDACVEVTIGKPESP
jgi:hypothetical protein